MNILVQLDPEAAMQELAGQEGGVKVEEGAVAGTEEVAEQAYQERYIITVQVIFTSELNILFELNCNVLVRPGLSPASS